MNRRIVLNVTTSAEWCRHPVGIVRVERELTKAVFQYFGDAVIPVFLDRNTNQFKQIDQSCFHDLMSDKWILSEDPTVDSLRVQRHLSQFAPTDRDRFVTVGSDWSWRIPDVVEQTYGTKRVMVAALYDLIPLMFPEFAPGSEFHEQFNYHYRALTRLAESIFSISETSAETLRLFWRDRGLLEGAPPIHVVPLAAPVQADTAGTLTEVDKAKLNDIQGEEDFVLYVSTIEPRKNHQLLLDVWRDLYSERGENCPKLVLVGVKGWGSDDLVAAASKMNAFTAGKIVFESGISDKLLVELYRRSLFSVFPSYFEGWGLAATEAASFGKVCLVSNTSALVEATHGVMPSRHPLDFVGWKSEIERLIDDKRYRSKLEAAISAGRFERDWKNFGQEFCERILDLP
ncbi:glycosyltransferase family 1 protein [Sphingomonas sp. 10B4]|uniref:glycosyltransferase family 4 protein n=1 Tax=Sphingomonas sp. 10B4 TaxID=3048575 RepID=UPI002AB42ADF|nr:glycosyltransferase family 1 protein [Sphingomonas sp. 10B4]MDY7523909.1 glycosyltransferase family 1 protein [Sphingomonas sp. 10B4]MEB0284516.1 glycosyltransferase family 1 protein [Sphingomonas sp. 10B4]